MTRNLDVRFGLFLQFSHWVKRGSFFDAGIKFNIEPNGAIFDVRPKNDHASPNVKTPIYSGRITRGVKRCVAGSVRHYVTLESRCCGNGTLND